VLSQNKSVRADVSLQLERIRGAIEDGSFDELREQMTNDKWRNTRVGNGELHGLKFGKHTGWKLQIARIGVDKAHGFLSCCLAGFMQTPYPYKYKRSY